MKELVLKLQMFADPANIPLICGLGVPIKRMLVKTVISWRAQVGSPIRAAADCLASALLIPYACVT